MGVDTVIEDEHGKPAQRLFDPTNRFAIVLSLPGLENTVCLRFIDPYGDTVFNQLQIPHLILELEHVRARLVEAARPPEAVLAFEEAQRAGEFNGILCDFGPSITRSVAQSVLDHLDSVLTLAATAQAQVHTYLKFYGD